MNHPAPSLDRISQTVRSRASCRWPAPWAAACALAMLTAPAGRAWAQASPPSNSANLDVARSVAVSGREAFNAGDYETALSLFRKAYELFPAPTVVLYEARTLEKMGLLIEAVDAFGRTTRTPVPAGAPAQFAEAIAAARSEGVSVVPADNFLANREMPVHAVRVSLNPSFNPDVLLKGLDVLNRLLASGPRLRQTVI